MTTNAIEAAAEANANDNDMEDVLSATKAEKLGVHPRPIPYLHEACVLSQRGGANLQRWANHEYRNIVYDYRPAFYEAENNGEKNRITMAAIHEVEDGGLQLVKKVGDRFYLLTASRIYRKVIQLLRDGKPGVGKNKGHSVGDVFRENKLPPAPSRASPAKKSPTRRTSASKKGDMRAPPAPVKGAPPSPSPLPVSKKLKATPPPPPAPVPKTTAPFTQEDELELWTFWLILPEEERKAIALRRGFSSIGAYEEHLISANRVMAEDYTFGAAQFALPDVVLGGNTMAAPQDAPQEAPTAVQELPPATLELPMVDDDEQSTGSFLGDLDDLFDPVLDGDDKKPASTSALEHLEALEGQEIQPKTTKINGADIAVRKAGLATMRAANESKAFLQSLLAP